MPLAAAPYRANGLVHWRKAATHTASRSGETKLYSYFNGIRVRSFILNGAPVRYTLLTAKLAVLPMQAVELHSLTARLTISMYYDDELSTVTAIP
jgi:hypothetical protein